MNLEPFIEITQKAALVCYSSIGKKDPKSSDQLAVSSMRDSFNDLNMDISIVIGEGERDKAPRLYTGEQLGNPNSSVKWDVAVDPLEGTNLCAEDKPGALSVMGISARNHLFKAPDIYMKKLACGPQAKNVIDLQAPVKENLKKTAQALGKKIEDLRVGVLNRSRHARLIREIKEEKAQVYLVEDGDISLSLQTILNSAPLDLLMGIGGAPEGVLSAIALKCLGGGFQGQLVYQNSKERDRAYSVGVRNLDKIWNQDELVQGPAYFIATGVTTGPLLDGVKKELSTYLSHTLVLSKENALQEFRKKHIL
ncbi:MAG: class II fructose-bisphosphatase [Bdellovibrionales bacterium]|nr:class II fructose-bisphosphatase [Bdellovibrionales bacterium]